MGECRLSESRALMRSLGDPGRSEGVPYAETWISSGMPTTSTSEWSTSPANSAMIFEKVDRLISEMNSEHEALEEGKRELGEAGPSGELGRRIRAKTRESRPLPRKRTEKVGVRSLF